MPCLPIAGVVFDLDDTLHDDTLSFRQAAAHVALELQDRSGVLVEDIVAAYVKRLSAFWSTLSAESVRANMRGVRERMWAATLSDVGLDPALAAESARRYDAFRREHFILWPGVGDILLQLRKCGSKLALLTNGFAETHREKIEMLGLATAFDEIFISDEVGMVKPDPNLFLLVLERLGVPAENATMIGDRHSKDIAGAHSVGMSTIWLDLHGEMVPTGAKIADARVANISGAIQVLQESIHSRLSHVEGKMS